MANPQKEEGHLRVANEIIDALIAIRIPGEARQIVDFVLRKTYGFGKKSDYISLSQFQLATGMPKRSVLRAIATAKGMRLIGVEKDTLGRNFWHFNKDFEQWVRVSKKTPRVSKTTLVGDKNDTQGVSKTRHTINNSTINNITKDISSSEPKRKAVKNFGKTSREFLLARHLYDEILKNNPNHKAPNFQNWAGVVDKMIRCDNRTAEQIDYLIHWCQEDSFWKSNILSTEKLREKFDQLVLRIKGNYDKARKNEIVEV